MKYKCEKCGEEAPAEQFGDGCPYCEAQIPTIFTKRENKMTKPNEINQLVDRAAEISDHIKNLESQLEPLKKKIEVHVRENCTDKEILAGITIKGKVGSVEIIGGEKRADANPKKTLDYMEKQGLAGKFFDVVKVQAGKLSALIGVDACNRLRPVTGVSIRQSFKVEGK